MKLLRFPLLVFFAAIASAPWSALAADAPAPAAPAPVTPANDDYYVYFGTHRAGAGLGFSLAHFNADTGELTVPKFELQSSSPAFFVIGPDGKHLYAANSGDTFQGQPGGGVSAFAIAPATGHLTALNTRPAGGADTSYISLDRTGRFALVANYKDGNIAVFALQPDGSLGDRTAFVQHTGRSVDPVRQTHAYAHSIITDPTNRFALVADLGLDKVFVYRFDEKTGALTPNDPAFVSVKPGSGPRHPVFHPNGKIVYVISEIASTVTAFHWDSAKGTLAEFQIISALPADFKGTSTCAEIAIHPNGKFLYASNRGHDSLAVFAIDAKDGHLSLVQHVPSGGQTPRNFAFDPTGKWILATNHGSNNAVVFRVDAGTGKLTQTGEPVSVPYPFCERFLAAPPAAVVISKIELDKNVGTKIRVIGIYRDAFKGSRLLDCGFAVLEITDNSFETKNSDGSFTSGLKDGDHIEVEADLKFFKEHLLGEVDVNLPAQANDESVRTINGKEYFVSPSVYTIENARLISKR